MSFWKSLFGGSKSSESGAPRTLREAEHKGFRIEAQPFLEGGQYQLSGRICKEIAGITQEHRFIRADRFATAEEAAEFTLIKARQIIDQQGDKLFG
ncbi:MAG: HlyU family transcriptional regulator [Hyphomicrobiaceae bacterium]